MQNSDLEFTILNTIKEIPQKDWDNLFGQGLIESYGYQKTIEESGLREFKFGYAITKCSNEINGIIPFFIRPYPLGALLPQAMRKLLPGLSKSFNIKLMFLGLTIAEEFSMGLAPEANFEEIMNKMLGGLLSLSRREKITAVLFNNLNKNNSNLAEILRAEGFSTIQTLPNTYIDIKASSLEEHITGLSRNARKDIKKKLRRSNELAQLKTEVCDNIDSILPKIYDLYLNNLNESDVNFENLTPEFFLNISKNMPGVAKYFITYDNDKIVAFNLCFIKDGKCIDKFIGFDKELAHKYHLYFTTFAHNIEWCIKNGIYTYQLGQTDYHPKLRLGAKLLPLFIYAKSANPILNLSLRMLSRFIQPRNLDRSLSKINQSKFQADLKTIPDFKLF